MKKSRFNLTMYIGFAAIGIFAILLWSFLSNNEPEMVTALVPAPSGPGIQAFREVSPGDLQAQEINADAALQDTIVTQAWFADQVAKNPLYTVTNLLPGQIIDKKALQANPSASYQIVLPDERVVGVTTDLSGAMAGTLRAGDVVTAIADGGDLGPVAAQFAKIISIGVGASAGQGVAGTTNPIGSGEDGGIQVLLAVDKNDAAAITGKSVRMVLNPFCAVVGSSRGDGAPAKGKSVGQIVPLQGRETGCEVTSSRAASTN